MRTVLLLFVILSWGCAPEDTANCHYRITFNNQSAQELYVKWRRDTLYAPNGSPDPRNDQNNLVDALSTSSVALAFVTSGKPTCVEEIIEEEGIIYIYVYDSVLFDLYTWEQMKEQDIYSRRYDLNVAELRQMGFTIVYEGT